MRTAKALMQSIPTTIVGGLSGVYAYAVLSRLVRAADHQGQIVEAAERKPTPPCAIGVPLYDQIVVVEMLRHLRVDVPPEW